MKITICTFGTRGDIQPYLALAVGLQQAGHQVTLAAAQNFAEWIRSYGINAHPVRIDAQAGMQEPKIKAAMQSRNLLRQLQGFRHGTEILMEEALDDCWQAAQEAEFVILGTTAHCGVDIASQRNLPMAFVALQAAPSPARWRLSNAMLWILTNAGKKNLRNDTERTSQYDNRKASHVRRGGDCGHRRRIRHRSQPG